MNMNQHGIDTDLIETGDRVLISKDENDWEKDEWGTVAHDFGLGGPKVYMDDSELEESEAFSDPGNGNKLCYYAYHNEIIQHIPANKVSMHEGKPVNVEDHAEPKPLTAHDDIQATLDFLHATTKRKWKATTKDVRLDIGGTTTYAGTMTIAFTEDKQS